MPDWKILLQEHGPAVWRTAFRLLANHADADDCYQETFADALRRTRSDKRPIENWHAFLVRLATARSIDRLRERMRRTSKERPTDDMRSHIDADRQCSPQTRAEDAEQAAKSRMIIARLPPKQADAFCLHCLEGWSYLEVAKSLGISTDHVGILISRARAALREHLAAVLSKESLAELSSKAKVLP
jgi:RNA polymerase sigma-70 factor (ECF subfamily)